MKKSFMKGMAIGAITTAVIIQKDPSTKSLIKKGKKALKNKINEML